MALGEWGEGASVLILFAIGLTLQRLTLERTRRGITSLLSLAPQRATILSNGIPVEFSVAEVRTGDLLLVWPGERAPVDAAVVEGRSAVDASLITGESLPVVVEAGIHDHVERHHDHDQDYERQD